MSEVNPYATPNAQVNDMHTDGMGEIKLLTPKGRMGRLRYFVYSMSILLLGYFSMGIIGGLLSAISPVLGGIVASIILIVMIVVSIFVTIQRCHDFNISGWLSLLLLLPFAPLIFFFIPGTKGSNKYGFMPPKNSTGVIVSAVLIPLVMIVFIGILASIAMPAYQTYIDRVEKAQSLVDDKKKELTEKLEKLEKKSN